MADIFMTEKIKGFAGNLQFDKDGRLINKGIRGVVLGEDEILLFAPSEYDWDISRSEPKLRRIDGEKSV